MMLLNTIKKKFQKQTDAQTDFRLSDFIQQPEARRYTILVKALLCQNSSLYLVAFLRYHVHTHRHNYKPAFYFTLDGLKGRFIKMPKSNFSTIYTPLIVKKNWIVILYDPPPSATKRCYPLCDIHYFFFLPKSTYIYLVTESGIPISSGNATLGGYVVNQIIACVDKSRKDSRFELNKTHQFGACKNYAAGQIRSRLLLHVMTSHLPSVPATSKRPVITPS